MLTAQHTDADANCSVRRDDHAFGSVQTPDASNSELSGLFVCVKPLLSVGSGVLTVMQ